MNLSLTARLRRVPHFNDDESITITTFGISGRFQPLFPSKRQVIHVLLTLSPLSNRSYFVRLACLIHAVSIQSEPRSNSQYI